MTGGAHPAGHPAGRLPEHPSAHLSAAKDFLKQTRMTAETIDMETGVGLFLDEMEKGLAADGASLQMLPTYVGTEGDLPLNRPVLVLDAGGTNFRVARVSFDSSGTPVIESFVKNPMPGTRGTVDKKTFFHSIVDYMAGHLDSWNEKEAPAVGFCFSYPTAINPDGDGRLVHFTKEVEAPEVAGELIVANLLEALAERGFRPPRRTVLLNDTVATLLAGKAASTSISSDAAAATAAISAAAGAGTSAARDYDGYIGFILGTGTNCAYVEENRRIGKLAASAGSAGTSAAAAAQSAAGGSQVINIESGGMNRIPGGSIDDLFDADTINPGRYRFEKMVSGAYLGPLAGRLLVEAVEAGVFSEKAAAELRQIEEFNTILVDGFLHAPTDRQNPIALACGDPDDRAAAYVLLDAVIDRAAKLAAVNLAATSLREGGGKDPGRPLAICADGTTFYRTKDLLFRTRHYLHSYLQQEKEVYFEMVHRDDAPIIGSAVAALLEQ